MKKILIGSLAITGLSSIVFASVFGFYYNKYSNLEKATKDLWGNKQIHIYAYNKNGTETFDKIYKTKKNEKTLADLMLDNKDDFSLTKPGPYGSFVNRIGKLEALFANGTWWQLTSKTYLESSPESGNQIKGGETTKPYALNIGVSFAYLLRNEVFKFYETKAK